MVFGEEYTFGAATSTEHSNGPDNPLFTENVPWVARGEEKVKNKRDVLTSIAFNFFSCAFGDTGSYYYPQRQIEKLSPPVPTRVPLSLFTLAKRLELLPAKYGIEPVFVVFNGPPGCGKTLICEYLIQKFRSEGLGVSTKVMGDTFMDDIMRQEIELKRANRYGAHVHFYDEMFMEVKDATKDCKFIITNCTSTKNNPVVADLQLKGSRTRPFLWLVTSNNLDKFECKVDKSAVLRRISIRVDCRKDWNGDIELKIDGFPYTKRELMIQIQLKIEDKLSFVERFFEEEVPVISPPSPSTSQAQIETPSFIKTDFQALLPQKRDCLFKNDTIRVLEPFVFKVDGLRREDFEKLSDFHCVRLGFSTAIVSNVAGFSLVDFDYNRAVADGIKVTP